MKIVIKDDNFVITENCKIRVKESVSFYTPDSLITLKYEECEDEGDEGLLLLSKSRNENQEIVNKILIIVRTYNKDGTIYKEHSCMSYIGTRCAPFLMQFGRKLLNNKSIVLNITIIHKDIQMLPEFKYGDLRLDFNDGECLYIYKNFIAKVSLVFDEMLKGQMKSNDLIVMKIDECPSYIFKEALYQLLCRERPIWESFTYVAFVAVKYDIPFLRHKLSLHVAGFDGYKWIQKMNSAISLDLKEAVIMLSKMASRTGLWDSLLSKGLQPTEAFGDEIYDKFIKPYINIDNERMRNNNIIKRTIF
uniref:BTB domain-containing protein n=1 Tax=Parastrongyloides trichosuri TaxID=131310 RepID=A0A0N4ZZ73_PARTI